MITYRAADPQRYVGQVVGNGHCVRLVQLAADAPPTVHWRRGPRVRGGETAPGAAIATFTPQGRYANAEDGSSHAALFLAEEVGGLRVIDQWVGRRCAERTIRFKGGSGPAADDGDRFYVITREDNQG